MEQILSVIMPYLSPHQLHTFFNIHHINTHIKFKYDERHYILTMDHARYIFHIFPNIIITGMCVKCCATNPKMDAIFAKLLLNLIHLTIYGNIRQIIPHISHISHNITSIYYVRASSTDICDLISFNNLQSLTLFDVGYLPHIDDLIKLPYLHTFKMFLNNFGISNRDCNALSKCKQLKYLELQGDLFRDDPCILTCPNLRHFKYVGLKHTLTTISFEQCHNLHTVKLSCPIKDAYSFPSNIHSIRFTKCTKLKDTSWLKEYPTLKYVTFNQCVDLTHIVLPKGCVAKIK